MSLPFSPRRTSDDTPSEDPWGFGKAEGQLVDMQRGAIPPARLRDRLQWSSRDRRRALVALAVAAAAGFGYVAARPTSPPVAASASTSGALVLSSHPPGARVEVDDVPAGVTPLVVDLRPGTHTAVISHENGWSELVSAEVRAGETVTRHVSLGPALPNPGDTSTTASAAPRTTAATGALAIDAPFEVQVFAAGVRIGSSTQRLRLRTGRHTLSLVNDELGYREQATVRVESGRTASLAVEPRQAPLSVNAEPWAEVLVAGRSYGETPVANIPLPLGPTTVTLHHPTLGQRTVPVLIRIGTPNRVSVNLRAAQ
jgi:hypothetical protein